MEISASSKYSNLCRKIGATSRVFQLCPGVANKVNLQIKVECQYCVFDMALSEGEIDTRSLDCLFLSVVDAFAISLTRQKGLQSNCAPMLLIL